MRPQGWQWLRMEVADDAGLALLIAEAGGPFCRREPHWMVSTALGTLGAMFRGLEKNASLVASHGKPWQMAVGAQAVLPWPCPSWAQY